MKSIINDLSSIDIYLDIFSSIKNVMIGFLIASIIAIVLALLLYEFKLLKKIFYPILELLRPIPNAAWLPIAIILFRTTQESILFITFIGAFFPMFINLYRALNNIPKNYLYFSKLYKLNLKDKIFKILLPAITSEIFTALMLGISGAWLSVIMAEMISGKEGIGYYTWKNYTLLNYEKVILGIIIMGLIGSFFSHIISLISNKVLAYDLKGEV